MRLKARTPQTGQRATGARYMPAGENLLKKPGESRMPVPPSPRVSYTASDCPNKVRHDIPDRTQTLRQCATVDTASFRLPSQTHDDADHRLFHLSNSTDQNNSILIDFCTMKRMCIHKVPRQKVRSHLHRPSDNVKSLLTTARSLEGRRHPRLPPFSPRNCAT
jgi:hypothetical protein